MQELQMFLIRKGDLRNRTEFCRIPTTKFLVWQTGFLVDLYECFLHHVLYDSLKLFKNALLQKIKKF